jgi:pyridoxine 5'-phosphate synthase PdxJ
MAAIMEKPVPMRVTIHLRGQDTRHAESENVQAIWRVVHAAQALGAWVRLDFYAARELIRAGAFEDTWSTLVMEALRQLNELHEGTGCGIGSSDVNHTVVGLVQGRPVLEPVA